MKLYNVHISPYLPEEKNNTTFKARFITITRRVIPPLYTDGFRSFIQQVTVAGNNAVENIRHFTIDLIAKSLVQQDQVD